MKLNEWLNSTNARFHEFGYPPNFRSQYSDTAIQIFTDSLTSQQRWDLFHLDDFAVSSVASGPSVWLWNRETLEIMELEELNG